MTPVQCERTREWISLELDGMLSSFEAALLRRHLRRCGECRLFAADVRDHTALLRAAPLERPAAIALPPARTRIGRSVAGVLGASVAAIAAAVLLTTMQVPTGGPSAAPTVASVPTAPGARVVSISASPHGPTVPRRMLASETTGVRGVFSLAV